MASAMPICISGDAPLANPFDSTWYDEADWSSQKVTSRAVSDDEGDLPSNGSSRRIETAADTASSVIVLDDSDVSDDPYGSSSGSSDSDSNSGGDHDVHDDYTATLVQTSDLPVSLTSTAVHASHTALQPTQTTKAMVDTSILQFFQRNALAMMMAASKSHASSTPTPGKPRHKTDEKAAKQQNKSKTSRKSGSSFYVNYGKCPFYKRIPQTPFSVDAFHYTSSLATKHHFLTHFHSDHYGGLTRHFDSGLVYCTPITSALAQLKLNLKAKYIRAIGYNTPTIVEGVKVTLLDANHCPGAAMVLFELPSGQAHLHVGDFRWHPRMLSYPALEPYTNRLSIKRLDTLYLDTTYATPEYDFPPQEACVQAAVQLAKKYAEDPSVLLMFGSYTIGKERIFLEVAKELNEMIFVDKTKWKTLNCLDWTKEELSRLTMDATKARIHVVPMGHLTLSRLHAKLNAMHVAAGATSASKRPALKAIPANTKVAGSGRNKFRGSLFQSFLASQPAVTAAVDAKPMLTVGMPAPVAVPASEASRTYGGFHSIVAFRPTGWAHGDKSHKAADAFDEEEHTFDISTQLPSNWNRKKDAEDDLTTKLPGVGDSVEDARETRRSKIIAHGVVIPAEDIDDLAGATGTYVTVRIKQQTKAGGARISAGADLPTNSSGKRPATGVRSKGGITLYSIPYSEHSAFSELKSCVAALDPVDIIPTVNCRSAEDAQRMKALLRHK